MRRPLVLIRGESYFVARCPKTGEVLDAIRDTTHGTYRSVGEWVVGCPECRDQHTFDLAELSSELLQPIVSQVLPNPARRRRRGRIYPKSASESDLWGDAVGSGRATSPAGSGDPSVVTPVEH